MNDSLCDFWDKIDTNEDESIDIEDFLESLQKPEEVIVLRTQLPLDF